MWLPQLKDVRGKAKKLTRKNWNSLTSHWKPGVLVGNKDFVYSWKKEKRIKRQFTGRYQQLWKRKSNCDRGWCSEAHVQQHGLFCMLQSIAQSPGHPRALINPLSIPYQPSTPQKNEIFIKKKGGGNYCLWFLHAHEADVELYYVFFFAIKKKEGKFEESFNRKTKAVKQLCINS